MKKIALFFSVVLLAGCQSTTKESNSNKIPIYSSSAEDIIMNNGEINNSGRFKEFLNNIENERKDTIRIVRYTTEGDPILHELDYDKKVIHSLYDSRRDQYGSGKIEKATCTSIEVNESIEYTSYTLNGCNNSIDYILLESPKM